MNDGLWLFSLQGEIESLPPGSGDPPPDLESNRAPANGAEATDPRAFLAELDLQRAPNLGRGAEIYRTVCQTCHGPMGEGGHLGKPFTRGLAVVDIVVTARSGVDGKTGRFGNGRSGD